MRMSVVLFDGFTALDVVGGYEVLANVPGIEVEIVAAEVGLVAADTRRLGLHAYRRLADTPLTDLLYIPGGPGVFNSIHDAALLAAITRLHASATWTFAVCNGVELLGAAGLLRGKQVTTNWFARDRVAAHGARVEKARFVRDGRLVTAAGVSASIDAGLFLAGLIAGEEIAKTIQLGIEYYPEPPFGNGTPDTASTTAQAMVRLFEESSVERLRDAKAPFERSSP
jgi:putative intracellular protease/amidase